MKALNARWKILNQLNPVFLENLAVSDRPADQFVAEFNDDRFTSTSSPLTRFIPAVFLKDRAGVRADF